MAHESRIAKRPLLDCTSRYIIPYTDTSNVVLPPLIQSSDPCVVRVVAPRLIPPGRRGGARFRTTRLVRAPHFPELLEPVLGPFYSSDRVVVLFYEKVVRARPVRPFLFSRLRCRGRRLHRVCVCACVSIYLRMSLIMKCICFYKHIFFLMP